MDDLIIEVQPQATLLGTTLRRLRKYHGLTVSALAEKANIDKSVISRLETGSNRTAQKANLRALAIALDVPEHVLQELSQHNTIPMSKDVKKLIKDGVPSEQRELHGSDILMWAEESLPKLRQSADMESDKRIKRQLLTMVSSIEALIKSKTMELKEQETPKNECESIS